MLKRNEEVADLRGRLWGALGQTISRKQWRHVPARIQLFLELSSRVPQFVTVVLTYEGISHRHRIAVDEVHAKSDTELAILTEHMMEAFVVRMRITE